MDWIATLTLINTAAVVVLGVLMYRLVRRETAPSDRFPGVEERREARGQEASPGAALRPRLVRSGTTVRLLVENTGQGEARNVEIELEGTPLQDHPLFVHGQPAGASVIGPGGQIDLLLAPSQGASSPAHLVELRWEDDSGSDRRFRTQLS